MGYNYTVRGGEYYAHELVYSLYLGFSIADAIDRANTVYKLQNPNFIVEEDEVGNTLYSSPHDPRNQNIIGDTSTILYTPSVSPYPPTNGFLLSESAESISCVNENQANDESKYVLTTQFSSAHNLVNGPDETSHYYLTIKNGTEYYCDDEGRIVLIYTNQTKAQNSDVVLSTELLEQSARAFLSSNDIAIENYDVSEVMESVVGHLLIFEDEQSNAISVSMYDNGVVSGVNIYYGDVFLSDISAEDEQYFAEQFQNSIAEEKADTISSYSVSYQKINETLYATYSITYRDANGLYYCEDMTFGK